MLNVSPQQTKTVLFCAGAATAYGVIHDQITVRVCLEYFTVGHPSFFGVTSTTLLATCWGIAATLSIGILLGVLLALVSQSPGPPPVPFARLCKLILVLLATMAALASLAGVVGYELSRRSIINLPAGFAAAIREERHARFMAAWFAHGASYFVGLVGSALIIGRIWRERGCPRVVGVFPRTKGAIIRMLVLFALMVFVAWWRLIR